jgi:hypothetical protein
MQPKMEITVREVERMRPEIERAAKQAADAAPMIAYANRQIELLRPELDRMQRELCRERTLIKQDSDEMKRDLEKQGEKLGHEIRGEWTEI